MCLKFYSNHLKGVEHMESINMKSIYVHLYIDVIILSRLKIVSREAKKKQAVRNERVSYLQVAPL